MDPNDNLSNYPGIEVLAELCFQKFRSLPKTGKPTANEWTVLAGIIQNNVDTGDNEVVALGLGTKCIGRAKLCSDGLIMNDSHAEILARRSLMRYMYHEIRKATTAPNESIFLWNDQSCAYQLRPSLTFHFFCTQIPCGDASILTREEELLYIVEQPPTKKVKYAEVNNPRDTLCGDTCQSSMDQIFTGAKLIGLRPDNEDCMQQMIGALRTKPGRGDRTLSMSCSDKLAKWNVLGVQGALLDSVLQAPIYLKTLNFCSISNDHKESIQRAVYDRWMHKKDVFPKDGKLRVQQPEIRTCSTIRYEFDVNEERQPSPNGLVWCKINEEFKPYEVSVNGMRQGVNVKKVKTPAASLKVSKYHLLREFIELLRSNMKLQEKFKLQANDLDNISYKRCKQLANEYQETWNTAKNDYFGHWTEKPHILNNFCLNKNECKM